MVKERGLYITSCGLVVSIYQSSTETPHAGYRVIVAKMTTCDGCRKNEGKHLMVAVDNDR
ncbi:MAG: hypothetical protein ACXADC_10195 [Candidatus Thorarchaeota archaeon]